MTDRQFLEEMRPLVRATERIAKALETLASAVRPPRFTSEPAVVRVIREDG